MCLTENAFFEVITESKNCKNRDFIQSHFFILQGLHLKPFEAATSIQPPWPSVVVSGYRLGSFLRRAANKFSSVGVGCGERNIFENVE